MNTNKNHLPDWIGALLQDNSLWEEFSAEDYPALIRHEYFRLRTLLEKGQIFSLVFQLKDVGEVLLKFPILCSAAILRKDEITAMMVKKPLSLGDWQEIAAKLLRQENHQYVHPIPPPLLFILSDIVQIYKKTMFINRRNRFIGHGALGFDDNAEYRSYCQELLTAFAGHLRRMKEHYSRLNLTREEGGQMWLRLENSRTLLNPFMVHIRQSCYFFDYLDGSKKTLPSFGLDYITGGAHRSYDAPYFANVFVRSGFPRVSSFRAEDGVSDLEAENALRDLNGAAGFVTPAPLVEWLRDNVVNESRGGVHLLMMQRGMGKTAFAYALERSTIRLRGVKVCAYYCSHSQMRGVGNFVQEVMNALRGTLVETVYGALPRLMPDAEDKARNMTEVLQSYKEVYTHRGEGSRLLLILDGLDEIPAGCADVFGYIPGSLPDNIHILLTARDPEKETLAPHAAQAIAALRPQSRYTLRPDSPENLETLQTCLSAPDMQKTENGFRPFTGEEIRRLIALSGGTFLNLGIYTKLTGAGYAAMQLPELSSEKLFDYYLAQLKEVYGEKLFREAVTLLLTLSAAEENLTLQELAYLCGYPGITLRLLSFVKDFGALIKTMRQNLRGSTLTLANESYREYALRIFAGELQQLNGSLLDRFLQEDLSLYCTEDGTESIPDGVLYLAAHVSGCLKGQPELLAKARQEKLWEKLEELAQAVEGARYYRLQRAIDAYTCAEKLLPPSQREDRSRLAGGRAALKQKLSSFPSALEDYNLAIDLCRETDGAAPSNREMLLSLYMNRAVCFGSLNDHPSALKDYDLALKMLRRPRGLFGRPKTHGSGSEEKLAELYLNRATTLSAMQLHSRALEECNMAANTLQRLCAAGRTEHLQKLSMTLSNRAAIHFLLTNYENAVQDCTKAYDIALELSKSNRWEKESDLVHILINRANIHRKQGRLQDALGDMDLALQTAQRLYLVQEIHDENLLASACLNRAAVYEALTEYPKALEDLDRALEIRRRLRTQDLLPDEGELARTFSNRASVLLALLRWEEALRDSSEACSIAKSLLSEGRLADEHILADALTNRGLSQENLTRYEDACGDYCSALKILRRLIAKKKLRDEDEIAHLLLRRANCYQTLKQPMKALDDYEQALDIRRRLMKEKRLPHEDLLAEALLSRGAFLNSIQMFDQAAENLTEALEIRKRLLAEGLLADGGSVAEGYIERAAALAGNFHIQEAWQDLETAHRILQLMRKENRTVNEESSARLFQIRSLIYAMAQRRTPAIEDADRSLRIRLRLYQERKLQDENRVALSYRQKALCLMLLKEYEAAMQSCSQGIAFLRSLPEDRTDFVRDTLAALYHERGELLQDHLQMPQQAQADFEKERLLRGK